MTVPQKVRIAQMEDYYTEYVGKYDDGHQFMATIVDIAGTPTLLVSYFDAEGRHIRTEHWSDDDVEALRARRLSIVEGLDAAFLGDIDVQLFSVNIEGQEVGLFDESEGPNQPRVVLRPHDFLFCPPWDGHYDT